MTLENPNKNPRNPNQKILFFYPGNPTGIAGIKK
jgi:hypothetical protein